MLPEGIFELVFHHRTVTEQRFPGQPWVERPSLLVGGLHERGYQVRARTRGVTFVTRVRAGAAHTLLRENCHAFANAIPSAEHLFGRVGTTLEERLDSSCGFEQRVRVMEQFLTARLALGRAIVDHEIEHSVARILTCETGELQVSDLVTETGLAARTFRRRFRQHVGIGAKRFMQIAQLHRLIRWMKANPTSRLTDATYATGFCDQAHLSSSFRTLMGFVPATGIASDSRFGSSRRRSGDSQRIAHSIRAPQKHDTITWLRPARPVTSNRAFPRTPRRVENSTV